MLKWPNFKCYLMQRQKSGTSQVQFWNANLAPALLLNQRYVQSFLLQSVFSKLVFISKFPNPV